MTACPEGARGRNGRLGADASALGGGGRPRASMLASGGVRRRKHSGLAGVLIRLSGGAASRQHSTQLTQQRRAARPLAARRAEQPGKRRGRLLAHARWRASSRREHAVTRVASWLGRDAGTSARGFRRGPRTWPGLPARCDPDGGPKTPVCTVRPCMLSPVRPVPAGRPSGPVRHHGASTDARSATHKQPARHGRRSAGTCRRCRARLAPCARHANRLLATRAPARRHVRAAVRAPELDPRLRGPAVPCMRSAAGVWRAPANRPAHWQLRSRCAPRAVELAGRYGPDPITGPSFASGPLAPRGPVYRNALSAPSVLLVRKSLASRPCLVPPETTPPPPKTSLPGPQHQRPHGRWLPTPRLQGHCHTDCHTWQFLSHSDPGQTPRLGAWQTRTQHSRSARTCVGPGTSAMTMDHCPWCRQRRLRHPAPSIPPPGPPQPRGAQDPPPKR